MIIDSHVHIGITEKTERAYSFGGYLEFANSCGASRFVAMPNVSSTIPWSTLNYDFLTKFYKMQHRLHFSIYPLLLADARSFKTLNQLVLAVGILHGLKVPPSITQVKMNDVRMGGFLGFAKHNKLPVLVHCGRHETSHITYLIEVAKHYSEVTFIAAHLGGGATDLVEEAITLVNNAKVDNIYLDTSGVKLPWLIKLAVGRLGADKIIFGSDEPYADLRITKKCVELADLRPRLKEMIYYENATKVFKIPV